MKIEELEERSERYTKKVEGRDHLIKELETVIQELTEQIKRDQGLLALA